MKKLELKQIIKEEILKIINENLDDHFKVANELIKITGFSEDKADSVISGFTTSANLNNMNIYRKYIKNKDYKNAAKIIKKYWKGGR